MHHEIPGRPRAYPAAGAAMDTYSVRLTAWHARMLRRIGAGNLSRGVRVLLERRNVKPPGV